MGIREHILGSALVASASLGSVTSAAAQVPVALHSTVLVERTADNTRILEPASRLTRGDRVVTVLAWCSVPGQNFTLTNPMPRDVAYQGSSSGDEDVSVDGGRSWGKLGTLRIGQRLATPEDVTHVRWRIQSARAEGRITYSAIVR